MEKVSVIRERRSSIRLQVGAEGGIQVRAPRECTQSEIEDVLHRHARWIRSRQRAVREHEAVRMKPLTTLRVLGRELPVRYAEEKTVRLSGADQEIVLPRGVPLQDLEDPLGECLARLGRQYLPPRTELWANRFGLRVEKVTITSARKRWGSCTVQKHALHFSRWLMLASPKAVDAVIIHELMHLIEPNHSVAFHRLTEQNTPELSACERELKELAEYMAVIFP